MNERRKILLIGNVHTFTFSSLEVENFTFMKSNSHSLSAFPSISDKQYNNNDIIWSDEVEFFGTAKKKRKKRRKTRKFRCKLKIALLNNCFWLWVLNISVGKSSAALANLSETIIIVMTMKMYFYGVFLEPLY